MEMEYVPKITLTVLKMMMISGLDIFFQNPSMRELSFPYIMKLERFCPRLQI